MTQANQPKKLDTAHPANQSQPSRFNLLNYRGSYESALYMGAGTLAITGVGVAATLKGDHEAARSMFDVAKITGGIGGLNAGGTFMLEKARKKGLEKAEQRNQQGLKQNSESQ